MESIHWRYTHPVEGSEIESISSICNWRQPESKSEGARQREGFIILHFYIHKIMCIRKLATGVVWLHACHMGWVVLYASRYRQRFTASSEIIYSLWRTNDIKHICADDVCFYSTRKKKWFKREKHATAPLTALTMNKLKGGCNNEWKVSRRATL